MNGILLFGINTSALMTTSLHHKGKLVHASFPSNINTSGLVATLYCEGKVVHSFLSRTSTSEFPTITLHLKES